MSVVLQACAQFVPRVCLHSVGNSSVELRVARGVFIIVIHIDQLGVSMCPAFLVCIQKFGADLLDKLEKVVYVEAAEGTRFVDCMSRKPCLSLLLAIPIGVGRCLGHCVDTPLSAHRGGEDVELPVGSPRSCGRVVSR